MPREIDERKKANPAAILKSAGELSGGRDRLLTPKEAADFLRMSQSWLAKARMRGDGPAYSKNGRSVVYGEGDLVRYVKSRRRLSTSER